MAGRLTISLGALAHNYRALCDATTAEVAGVVKANAYGIGIETAVPCLHGAGCRAFFVATLGEAIRVRKVTQDALVYALEGPLADPAHYLAHDIIPVINSRHQFRRWAQAGPLAMHIDTGMERLGLPMAEGLDLLAQGARPNLILSHFARADDRGSDYTNEQIARIAEIRKAAPGVALSLSNSAGLLYHQIDEDVARAGIALYGGSPTGVTRDALEPVVLVEGEILQVRDVARGTPVGYGGTYIATEGARLATVGVGYADGIPRLLSNQGRVWLDGHFWPIVGRVSMDMVHVRCDGVDAARVTGECVELIGPHVAVDDVAALAQTLSYEVLTGLDAAGRLSRLQTEGLF